MPKLDRWLVASKMIEVLDGETLRRILELGGQIGGGWCQVHQHICVNQRNKEAIEELLESRGYVVAPAREFESSIKIRDHATAN